MPSPAAPRRPSSPDRERASPSSSTRHLGRAPDFKGLRALFADGLLADVTIVLSEDGQESHVPAHRAVLAGISDVWRAKFTGNFSDADAKTWTPEVGSAASWQWIIKWIYGYEDALPPSLLVEVLLLADHFQIESLAAGLQLHHIEDIAEEVVRHILQAWACPEALATLARRCVPLVVHSPDVWRRMWEAAPQNVALFLRFIPVLCEMDRVRVLAEYSQRQRSRYKIQGDIDEEDADVLPDCLLVAVNWEAFPAEVLEAASRDDVAGLVELTGFQMRSSQAMRDTMQRAITRRCRALEMQLQGRSRGNANATSCHNKERADMYLLAMGSDSLKLPAMMLSRGVACHHSSSSSCGPGLFGRLAGLGLGVEVRMSSVHPRTPRDRTRLFDCQDAFSNSAASTAQVMTFGTMDPSGDPEGTRRQLNADEQPWIEICTKDCEISPTALGVRHGWSDSHYCKSFIIEAMRSTPATDGAGAGLTVLGSLDGSAWSEAMPLIGGAAGGPLTLDSMAGRLDMYSEVDAMGGNGGEWTVLLSRVDHPLTTTGEVFMLDMKAAGLPDWVGYDRFRIRMTGPNDYGSWHLMVRWFDIFGQFRAKPSYFMGDGCRIEATL